MVGCRKCFSRLIKIAIIRKFDTQADFAQFIGTNETIISKVLRGRRKLSKKEAKKWMKALDCDIKVFNSITKS